VLRWVPGHIDVKGNEAADKDAKRAAHSDTRCTPSLPNFRVPTILQQPLPISRSAARQSHAESLRRRAIDTFENRRPSGAASQHCRRLRGVDRSAPSAKFRKTLGEHPLQRKAVSTLVRLPLNGHLHARRPHGTPLCPHCGDRKGVDLPLSHAVPSVQTCPKQTTVGFPRSNETHSAASRPRSTHGKTPGVRRRHG
jgi:hypothetical protein